MIRYCMAFLGLLLAISLAPSGTALADTLVKTTPGQPVIVDKVTGNVTKNTAKLGTVGLTQDSATPPNTTVIYIPPTGNNEIDDPISYTTANGTVKQATVQVRKADPTAADSMAYRESFKALFELFVIALLVESGLALLFRWRPFLATFDPAATVPVVSFIVSLILVWIFKLDVVTRLFVIYSDGQQQPQLIGMVLTAMIIAGGSKVVNKLFQALGMRTPLSQEEAQAPKPAPTQGWISVTAKRRAAVGTINVLLGPAGNLNVVGTLAVSTAPRIIRWMLRDKDRFPTTGGFSITPTAAGGQGYVISLNGSDKAGNPVSASWGPYAIAAGAIIDVELSI